MRSVSSRSLRFVNRGSVIDVAIKRKHQGKIEYPASSSPAELHGTRHITLVTLTSESEAHRRFCGPVATSAPARCIRCRSFEATFDRDETMNPVDKPFDVPSARSIKTI